MDETANRVYLVNFNNFRYAVREDDVVNLFIPIEIILLPSSREDRDIFVTTLDDDLFYLYDISHFLGCNAGDYESARQVFILSETDRINGFFINHTCDEPQVPELYLHLPEYIQSPFLNSVVVIKGKPFPLLNIYELHKKMLESNTPDEGISFKIKMSGERDVTAAESYCRYNYGHLTYCIPDFMVSESEIIKADIMPVSFYPIQVAGLACYQKSIIPVIRFTGNGEGKESEGHFIVFTAGGTNFGLCADTREGDMDPASLPVRELPPIARNGGWTHALVDEGKLYPLVDLYGILHGIGEKEVRDRFKDIYSPVSDFPSVFLNDVIEVMEFKFGGTCYGLPREEVAECFSFMEYSRFPGLPGMIPGILFYKDELLPVLDLALWSGEDSHRAKYRDMVFFVNGNLRLAIAVEKMLDWKIIERDRQREYRHFIVYGCYSDERLKLILNIHAMLKNYEKVKFTLIESSREEETGALPVEDETVPEEVPEPEEPVEITDEKMDKIKDVPEPEELVEITDDKMEKIKDVPEPVDSSAEKKREPPPVRKGMFTVKEETGKADRLTGEKPGNLKKEDVPVEQTSQTPEKREHPVEKREFPVKKTAVLLSLLALIIGVLFIFFFWGDADKTIDTNEEVKTNVEKVAIPKKEGAERRPAGESDAVKEIQKIEMKKPGKNKPGGEIFVLWEDDKSISFQHILFSADSAKLLPAEIQKLNGIASLLTVHREKKVRITGHTARFGTESGRKLLSNERAYAVGKYLVSTGACKEKQLSYRGMGAANPAADNSSPEGRKKNRRVEIFLFKE